MTVYKKQKYLAAARLLLAVPLIAIFAIPGSAEQPDNMTPQQRLSAMQAVMGTTLDTRAAAPFSIDLPDRFVFEPSTLALKFS